jgi:hypothetical protein
VLHDRELTAEDAENEERYFSAFLSVLCAAAV